MGREEIYANVFRKESGDANRLVSPLSKHQEQYFYTLIIKDFTPSEPIRTCRRGGMWKRWPWVTAGDREGGSQSQPQDKVTQLLINEIRPMARCDLLRDEVTN